ncbi:MAG: hypothetical protein H7326_10515 [Bdellovibrionaceae bacterium]|nr:hypothetical protein [Pseudobdellovibrionaceae bacterium]
MTKSRYWGLVALGSIVLAAVFAVALIEITHVADSNVEKVLAYSFLFFGFSGFYFGILKPHWFAKEIIPSVSPIKLKIKKEIDSKISLKDDSYFWNVFPHALFFSVAGIAYLLQPNPMSILVAFVCAAWVQILYKYV